ncbi:hypothetical protein J3F84DRAFT_358916 [Trichoderma pleuroticola]
MQYDKRVPSGYYEYLTVRYLMYGLSLPREAVLRTLARGVWSALPQSVVRATFV